MLKSDLFTSFSPRVPHEGNQANDESTSNVAPIVKYLLYFMLAVIVAVAIVFSIRGYQNAPSAEVSINPQGLSTAQYRALKQALGEQTSGNYFTADLQSLRNIALGLPWVDEVNIEREWPKSITVTALPKEAVAKFGTERLVDAKGSVFVPAEPSMADNSQLVTLQGNKSQAPVIMQQMQQINDWYRPLNLKVVDIILTPRMTWLVRFDSGLRVIVDNENTAQKLLNLSQLLSNQLSANLDDIQSVDLRYKNGFTITWKPDSESAIQAQQKRRSPPIDSFTSVSNDTPLD